MNEMVERVAKAMEGAVTVSDSVLIGGAVWTNAARAAITAMRQPTEKMCDAGQVVDDLDYEGIDDVWRAMIDAALAE